MEDISRELEKEIAQSKPKPYKKDVKTRILIVDDFGKLRPGEYLKTFVRVLSVFSLVCFVTAAVFIKLYFDLAETSGELEKTLETSQKLIEDLKSEKEIMTAKLVMAGQEPVAETAIAASEISVKQPVSKQPDKSAADRGPDPESTLETAAEDTGTKKIAAKLPEPLESGPAPGLSAPEEINETGPGGIDAADVKNEVVNSENFHLKKDERTGDLLVRFDIRKISKKPGDVTGRIFTVLKPESGGEDQWLVVPTAELKNGIPYHYKHGQYFSIAHFKPVKLRTKTSAGAEFFKSAAIYIFNNKGQIILEKTVEITEAD